jgi:hypothetical protein
MLLANVAPLGGTILDQGKQYVLLNAMRDSFALSVRKKIECRSAVGLNQLTLARDIPKIMQRMCTVLVVHQLEKRQNLVCTQQLLCSRVGTQTYLQAMICGCGKERI